MKFFRYLLSVPVILTLVFSETTFTSCQKEVVRDTIIRRDTVRIVDTLPCPSCYNLQDSLVAYYNFNKGNLNDSSGFNNHINFNNAIKTTDRFGRADNAYLFNGSTSYMTVPNSSSMNPATKISLMAIVKINDFYRGNCGANQIFGKGWNDFINGYYALRFGSVVGCNTTIDINKEVFNVGYGNLTGRAGVIDSTYYIQANKWYNVIYTFGSGVSKLYVNGILIRTTFATPTFTPNNQEMYIGKHGDPGFPYLFNGVIDEIRIYKKELCEEEVKLLNDLKS